ncbi:hypothetical protein KBB27_01425 [Patescibacteria group bacterium]|nr:hypothetical protein [Patescibacteria group bacterium]
MITYAPEVEQSLIHLQDRFVWETVSFDKYERGPKWYAVMGVTSLFLLAYSIWTENFLFAFLILLVDILLILGYRRDPQAVLVQIGENGIVWDGKLHLFQDLEHFSIIYEPPVVKTLYLQPKQGLPIPIKIDLEEQDPIALREHLCQFVRENLDLPKEYTSDTLARLLRL